MPALTVRFQENVDVANHDEIYEDILAATGGSDGATVAAFVLADDRREPPGVPEIDGYGGYCEQEPSSDPPRSELRTVPYP